MCRPRFADWPTAAADLDWSAQTLAVAPNGTEHATGTIDTVAIVSSGHHYGGWIGNPGHFKAQVDRSDYQLLGCGSAPGVESLYRSTLARVTASYWALLVVVLSGCGPAQTALVGVSVGRSGPVATIFVCHHEPRLEIQVFAGPTDKDFYTLIGQAHKHETVQVHLTGASPNWTVTGKRISLPRGRILYVASADGRGYYLGTAVEFRLDEAPASPMIGVHGEPLKVYSPADFLRHAREVC